jgi:hypothetical protein
MTRIPSIAYCLLGLFLHCALPPRVEAQTLRFSILPTLERVGKMDSLGGESELRISAAGNECEGAHIVLRAVDADAADIDLRVTTLENANGDSIPTSAVTLYREHELRIDTLSYRCTGKKGWYPDALIPFLNPIDASELTGARFDARPYTISRGENQGYYMEICVPKNTAPGEYRGEVIVTSANPDSLSIPVRFLVRAFCLPDETPVHSNFGIGGSVFNTIFSLGKPRWDTARYRFDEELIRHRLMPPYPYGTLCGYDSTGAVRTSAAHARSVYCYDSLHVNSAALPIWTNWPFPKLLTSEREKAQRYISSYYEYYRQNGWEKNLYTYLVDEPNERDLFTISTTRPKLKMTISWGAGLGIVDSSGTTIAFFDFVNPAFSTLNALRDSLASMPDFTVSKLLYAIPEGVQCGESLIRVDNVDISTPSKPAVVRFTQYEEVRQLATLVHEAAPDLKFLCTEQTSPSDGWGGNLYSSVDIWCPLFGYHDSVTATGCLNMGDEIWAYTALCQPGPRHEDSPYWQIDYPLLNYRIPLWIMWIQGMTGILYWETTYWQQSQDPWTNPASYVINSNLRYNGEGSLFYPGPDAGFDGPVTSLRLKAIRDGIEDYMYFRLAESLGLHSVLGWCVWSIAHGWLSWNPDQDALAAMRDSVAVAIEHRLATDADTPARACIDHEFGLGQNYPNPAYGTGNSPSAALTRIPYTLTSEEHVQLELFDILGRRIATLVDEVRRPGNHEVLLRAGLLQNGMYFYRLTVGRHSKAKRMLVAGR